MGNVFAHWVGACLKVKADNIELEEHLIEVARYLEEGKATTAFGAKADVPGDLDILVAGFSCVELSHLNPFRRY